MPLFGAFSEISIVDMVSLIGKSSGVLTISRFGGEHTYLIDVAAGKATALTFNDQAIPDKQQAISFLSEIVRTNDGEFVYSRRGKNKEQEPSAASPWYELELSDLASNALELSDEINMFRPHFPEPDTRFVLTSQPADGISSGLREFYESAQPHLSEGASANDLYATLGLYLDEILLRLYKLRLARLVEPKRLAYASFDLHKPLPAPQHTRPEEPVTGIAIDDELLSHGPLLPIWADTAPSQPEPALVPEPEPELPTPPQEQKPLPVSRSKIGGLMRSLKNLLLSR
jgi:hypothetical protein